MKPAELKNLTELEIVNCLGERATQQNHRACQCRSDDSQGDDNLGQRGTALVVPEVVQQVDCPPHIQSPAYCCHTTTRFLTLWPIRPATESESRIGPINRALTGARCELAAGEVTPKRGLRKHGGSGKPRMKGATNDACYFGFHSLANLARGLSSKVRTNWSAPDPDRRGFANDRD